MSQTDFQKLIDRVMTDGAFVDSLVTSPEATLKGAGIEPTAEIMDALKGADAQSLKNLAASFGKDRAAAAV